jgi:D-methionine transport system permease protein
MSLELLLKASLETIYMVFVAGSFAGLLGIPLGIALYIHSPGKNLQRPAVYSALAFIVNASRSIPFIILMVAIIPFTRLLVGSSIGTTAAIVPLSLAAIPFMARLVEGALMEIPSGLIEAAEAMGASPMQLILRVLWPEALGGIANALTVTLVNLVGYSAMAGVIGGGGLGDLAVRFGYQRFDGTVMLLTVVVLIFIVQSIQALGNLAGRWLRHER